MSSIRNVLDGIISELRGSTKLSYIADRSIKIGDTVEDVETLLSNIRTEWGIIVIPSNVPEEYEPRFGGRVNKTINSEIYLMKRDLKSDNRRVSSNQRNISDASEDVMNELNFNNLQGLLRARGAGNIGNVQAITTTAPTVSLRMLPHAAEIREVVA